MTDAMESKVEESVLQHLWLLLFIGNGILYGMRVNLSVAIVAMSGVSKSLHTGTISSDVLDSSDTCPYPDVVLNSTQVSWI